MSILAKLARPLRSNPEWTEEEVAQDQHEYEEGLVDLVDRLEPLTELQIGILVGVATDLLAERPEDPTSDVLVDLLRHPGFYIYGMRT